MGGPSTIDTAETSPAFAGDLSGSGKNNSTLSAHHPPISPAFFFPSETEDWASMGSRVVPVFLNIRPPTEELIA